MLKHHKFVSFLIGLAFVIVLQSLAHPEPVFRFLVPAYAAYMIAVFFYNRWYLQQLQSLNQWALIRNELLLAAGFGLYLIIPSEAVRGLFLLTGVGVIAFFELMLGKHSENIVLNETLFVAAGLFFALSAFSQYIPSYQTLYSVLIFAGTALLARSFYDYMPQSGEAKTVGALVLGLFASEIFWALSFLPLHFSALGIILFDFVYFALMMNYYFLFHTLNFKKMQFHLFLIVASGLLVIAATPWKILGQ